MRKQAFTVVELLVVIAIIGILASLLLISLNMAKQTAKAVQCANNNRTLTYGWLMYAHDNEDKLVPNHPLTVGRDTPSWMEGILRYGQSNHHDNTNTLHLENSLLHKYIDSFPIYKCPSDRTRNYHIVNGKEVKLPWVRSFGLNQYMAGPDFHENKAFFKSDQIDRPSDRLVFIGQRADTYENGYFVMGNVDLFKPERYRWHEFPARYHSNNSSVSFSDGHVELHEWKTEWPSMGDKHNTGPREYAPNNQDISWLASKATYEKKKKNMN
tara:strand:+ start:976 stop:1782 length:807 start_codon:yes stop_codon:yes gene_type:complete